MRKKKKYLQKDVESAGSTTLHLKWALVFLYLNDVSLFTWNWPSLVEKIIRITIAHVFTRPNQMSYREIYSS